MGRHAQAREVAELKGADKKNPQRYATTPPKNPSPIGEPPAYFKAPAKATWAEIVKNALPGVLTASDCYLMEMAANLLVEYRKAPGEFAIGKYSVLVGILARFGMSPTDRQKLGMPPNGDMRNEFEDLDQEPDKMHA